ncbi:MAG TPA: glycosyltransferase [Thermoanaerobaculia bacterium]|jgi:glycosyltransferase involved in cell wall biosynthesis|nr:glycosyltransferase [Thermoanaerobaculia bacterium]
MKVLMTADTVGGVWTYAIELARAASDVEFVIATMGRLPSESQRVAAGALPNVTLVSSEWKLEWMDDPWTDLVRAGVWLLDLETDHSPDFIHLNGYAHGVLPFTRPKLIVAHSCVLSWWDAVKNEPLPRSWKRYHDAVERGLAAADLLVAPSAWMLGALQHHYRFATPSKLIHNGRSPLPLVPQRRERRSIFAAGRIWDEAKNLSAVVDSAPKLDWPVRIAGDGGSNSANVEHLGILDEESIADAYADAGIYLFPALYEPFGLSVLEAALSGCALILGDIASLREIWGDAAIYVPPRDVSAIIEVTNALIADDDRRRALAAAATERAHQFTAERMAAQYRQVYINQTTRPRIITGEASTEARA